MPITPSPTEPCEPIDVDALFAAADDAPVTKILTDADADRALAAIEVRPGGRKEPSVYADGGEEIDIMDLFA